MCCPGSYIFNLSQLQMLFLLAEKICTVNTNMFCDFFKLYVGTTVPLITSQQPKMIHVFVGFA